MIKRNRVDVRLYPGNLEIEIDLETFLFHRLMINEIHFIAWSVVLL